MDGKNIRINFRSVFRSEANRETFRRRWNRSREEEEEEEGIDPRKRIWTGRFLDDREPVIRKYSCHICTGYITFLSGHTPLRSRRVFSITIFLVRSDQWFFPKIIFSTFIYIFPNYFYLKRAFFSTWLKKILISV